MAKCNEKRSSNTEQDTVFIAHTVPGWSRHVEQDKFCLLGLLYDDLVESYSCVHAPHIHLISNATNTKEKVPLRNTDERPTLHWFCCKMTSTHRFSHSLQQHVGGTLEVNNASKFVPVRQN